MTIRIRHAIAGLPVSPTLGANQVAADRRRDGHTVLHMGFGQAPFPVHPKLAEALAMAAGANGYEPVAGTEALRETACRYFAAKLGFDPEAYEVLVAPGSKLVLYALQAAIEGDLVLPVPSWVSYQPQAAMLGDRVIPVEVELSNDGYRVDPDRFRSAIRAARQSGLNPTKLILNSPNNPTGLSLPPDNHDALARACREEGIFVISDRIYGLVEFDGIGPSIANALPEGTAITTGLSKHLSLGGWRMGFGFVPKAATGLFDAVRAIASETWSAVAAPVQQAALVALSGDPEIERFIESCTRIHGAVAREAAGRVAGDCVRCAVPQGAFYLWPDFAPVRRSLSRRGIRTSRDLARALLEDFDVLALPGAAFGASEDSLTLRLSVCDYDGAEALAAVERSRTVRSVPVEDIAPRVLQGAEAVAAFSRGLIFREAE